MVVVIMLTAAPAGLIKMALFMKLYAATAKHWIRVLGIFL